MHKLIKETLFQAVYKENCKMVRHHICSTIGEIGGTLLSQSFNGKKLIFKPLIFVIRVIRAKFLA